MTRKIVIAYVPVIHQGYIDFFKKLNGPSVETFYVLGGDLISEFSRHEIRAIKPEFVRDIISIFSGASSKVLTKSDIKSLDEDDFHFVLPDELISRKFANKYLGFSQEIFFESVFLRWDEISVKKIAPVKYSRCSDNSGDSAIMEIAQGEAEKSSDWWRRVGAVLVKDGRIALKSHNRHLPSEHSPYINGDPRDVIEAGKDSHIATAVHSEQEIIARAAAEGISTKGVDIYVSVFPCPMCARLIALSGIKKCFFASGHASLDGEEIMKSAGVELIWVNRG